MWAKAKWRGDYKVSKLILTRSSAHHGPPCSNQHRKPWFLFNSNVLSIFFRLCCTLSFLLIVFHALSNLILKITPWLRSPYCLNFPVGEQLVQECQLMTKDSGCYLRALLRVQTLHPVLCLPLRTASAGCTCPYSSSYPAAYTVYIISDTSLCNLQHWVWTNEDNK